PVRSCVAGPTGGTCLESSIRRPNDCRISCNAASRATETAARFLRRLENGFAESAPPLSADYQSRPLGRRANKRRVVSFLQRLARLLARLSKQARWHSIRSGRFDITDL